MRKFINAELIEHSVKLSQMGARVQVVNSKMCFVLFEFEELEVSYVYNINKKGRYFLERIRPYPLALREFEEERDVIQTIAVDALKFKNARKSHNIDLFVRVNCELNELQSKFEALFLNYNVSKTDVEGLLKDIDDINNRIETSKETSDLIHLMTRFDEDDVE